MLRPAHATSLDPANGKPYKWTVYCACGYLQAYHSKSQAISEFDRHVAENALKIDTDSQIGNDDD